MSVDVYVAVVFVKLFVQHREEEEREVRVEEGRRHREGVGGTGQ